MLSRVADSIYWMARNIERAENLARFVDVTFGLMLDVPRNSAEQWQPLVSTTGDQEWFSERYGKATRDNVIQFLTFDPDYPSSILSCVRNARENARGIRETISSEMWEHLNHLYFTVMEASENRRHRAFAARFPRRDQTGEPSVHRNHRQHHVARQRLAFRSAGTLSRTGG